MGKTKKRHNWRARLQTKEDIDGTVEKEPEVSDTRPHPISLARCRFRRCCQAPPSGEIGASPAHHPLSLDMLDLSKISDRPSIVGEDILANSDGWSGFSMHLTIPVASFTWLHWSASLPCPRPRPLFHFSPYRLYMVPLSSTFCWRMQRRIRSV